MALAQQRHFIIEQKYCLHNWSVVVVIWQTSMDHSLSSTGRACPSSESHQWQLCSSCFLLRNFLFTQSFQITRQNQFSKMPRTQQAQSLLDIKNRSPQICLARYRIVSKPCGEKNVQPNKLTPRYFHQWPVLQSHLHQDFLFLYLFPVDGIIWRLHKSGVLHRAKKSQ